MELAAAIGGRRRDSIVLTLWRNRTGLRRIAGKRYVAVNAGCILSKVAVNRDRNSIERIDRNL